MKNVKTTKISIAYIAFLSMSIFSLTSCNNNKPEDSEEVAEEQNEARFEERKSEKDAQFLVDAAAINLEEINLGELAQQKGSMVDVKDLGKMMVKEHTAALDELKKLAKSKSIVLPTTLTEDGQDAYDKLNKETGKDFDKQYCDMMVKGHKDAIDKFEKISSKAEDGDIRNWAASMIPSLHNHLEHSIMCQERCAK